MIEFIQSNYRAAIEIFILWVGIYILYRAFKSSRGANIFLGIGITLVSLALTTYFLELKVIEWILTKVVALLAVGIIIIFNPEIRSTFARIGSASWMGLHLNTDDQLIDELTETIESLSKSRCGALIALENSVGLGDYISTGVEVDAVFSRALTESIFHPKTTLHDGGMFLRKNRIVAAGCLFPVSQKELADRSIGLRHRAGIGLSEETDAISIIVSEETGQISIATDGKLERDLSIADFRERVELIQGAPSKHKENPQKNEEGLTTAS